MLSPINIVLPVESWSLADPSRMTTPQILQYLYSLNTVPPEFPRYLDRLIQSDQQENYLSTRQGLELTRLVDFLDRALGLIPITDDASRRCLHKLQAICSSRAILPSSYIITGGLSKIGDYPVASGGFADVWVGTYGGIGVCIKCPRITLTDRDNVVRAFCREAVLWKGLRHQNIVSFIGVTLNPLQFVSEWMPNGNLVEYLKKNLGANRTGLLSDVAEGLAYLHARHTTHGDLKGLNVLIDGVGRARLADFGLASTVRELNSILVTKVQGYTPRWTAPEVISKGDRCTQEADVFSFAMVTMEVFTGKWPFSELTDPVVTWQILNGRRPDRPREQDLTDPVWYMTTRCWQQDPVRRPKMAEVVATLRECRGLSTTTLPGRVALRFLSLAFSPPLTSSATSFFVRVEYGITVYETQPTDPSLDCYEKSWFLQPCFLMGTNNGGQAQSISLKLFHKVPYGQDTLYAAGNFSLLGNLGKGFLVGLNVQGGAVSAALNVRLDGA